MPTIATQTETKFLEKRAPGRPKKLVEDKPKKAPSAYNIFMKEKMEELKEDPSYAELTPREKFKLAAESWGEFKLTLPEPEPKAKTPKTEVNSDGEVVQKKQMKCGACGGFGHNKRTCKGLIVEKPTVCSPVTSPVSSDTETSTTEKPLKVVKKVAKKSKKEPEPEPEPELPILEEVFGVETEDEEEEEKPPTPPPKKKVTKKKVEKKKVEKKKKDTPPPSEDEDDEELRGLLED